MDGTELSQRELEMLILITQGLTNQEIAEELYLSINTVKTYVRTAYRKIGAGRRSQAVIWGARHGYLDLQIPAIPLGAVTRVPAG